MLKFQHQGVQWDISFSHITLPNVSEQRITHVTECFILANGKHAGKGLAFCTCEDQFNRNTGRLVSLERAMEKMGYSEEFMKMVWDLYYDTVSKKIFRF